MAECWWLSVARVSIIPFSISVSFIFFLYLILGSLATSRSLYPSCFSPFIFFFLLYSLFSCRTFSPARPISILYRLSVSSSFFAREMSAALSWHAHEPLPRPWEYHADKHQARNCDTSVGVRQLTPDTSPYAGDACVAFKPTPKPPPYPRLSSSLSPDSESALPFLILSLFLFLSLCNSDVNDSREI